MESTTVRLSKDDKEKLERLQAEIFLSTGKRLTFSELLHHLISSGKEWLEQIIKDDNQNIDWEYIYNSIQDMGTTDSTDVDSIVYEDV